MSIPAVVAATTAFVEAANAQASALGYDPVMVYVPHPIQDRTDDEIRAIADDVFEEIVGKLTGAA